MFVTRTGLVPTQHHHGSAGQYPSFHSFILLYYHQIQTHSLPLHPQIIPSTSLPLLSRSSSRHLHLILGLLLAGDHLAQRTLLNHQAHNLIQRIRSRHGSMLGISIICRGNLDDISSDDVDALQTSEDGAEFTSRPAASLRGTRSRGDY